MRATISSVQQFWISKSCYEFHQLLDPQLVLQVILCSNATYVPAMYTWIFEQWRRWPSFAAASALDFLECSAYIGFDMFSLQFCCILIILCARISMQFSHLFYFHFEKKNNSNTHHFQCNQNCCAYFFACVFSSLFHPWNAINRLNATKCENKSIKSGIQILPRKKTGIFSWK